MNFIYKTVARLWEKRTFQYGSLFVAHAILAFLAFFRHFKSPLHTVFVDWGDGMKNNFTLLSFVKEPIGEEGVFKYGRMNYPFGDYVYATDNTPFFSVPFRWFCHNVYDLSDYSLAVFNFFIIGSVLLCGLLAFWVFKRIFKNDLLAWLLALILPWTNFQIPRIYRGHYNLSLALLSVLAIAFFILWTKYQAFKLKRFCLLLAIIIFCYCCFLAHGYYIAIIPVFLSGMLVFYGIYKLFLKEKGWSSIIAGMVVLASTGLLAYLTLRWTDAYLPMRQTVAMGYDWMQQKTNFSFFFTRYNFHSLFFPLWSTKDPNDTELMSYLGNIGLYTMAVFFLVSFFNRNFRILLWTIQKEFFSDPLKTGIVLSGLVLLSMSFGERYFPLMEPLGFSWPFRMDGSLTWPLLLVMLLLCLWLVVLLLGILKRKQPLLQIPYTMLPKERQARITRAVWFYALSAVLLYLMFGRYSIGHWVNITNPLWMAHKFTDLVEQFRSMVRFAWPFYWSFYIWLGFSLAAVYVRLAPRGKQLVIVLVLLLGGVETRDFIMELRRNANVTNKLSTQELESFDQLNIDFSKYQALLPIPYYNAGSEDYNNTIDDLGEWSNYTFRLSIHSSLPLMSGKMARTPPAYAHHLLDLLVRDTIPMEISNRLNAKPILLAIHTRFLNDSTLSVIPDPETRPYAHLAFWKANDFVSRHKLQWLGNDGEISFYKWIWQNNKLKGEKTL